MGILRARSHSRSFKAELNPSLCATLTFVQYAVMQNVTCFAESAQRFAAARSCLGEVSCWWLRQREGTKRHVSEPEAIKAQKRLRVYYGLT